MYRYIDRAGLLNNIIYRKYLGYNNNVKFIVYFEFSEYSFSLRYKYDFAKYEMEVIQRLSTGNL